MSSSIEMLRLLLDKCNQLAISADNAENTHHLMMLHHFIKNKKVIDPKTKRPFIEAQCILVSAKKGCLFVIPEFDLTFKTTAEATQVSQSIYSAPIDDTQPLN